jgi:ABC-type hemin transport system ATPase subunit
MLKSLKLKNFTVFPEADLEFGKNLNIIIGENSTGKSHILKLAYSIIAVSARGEKESGAAEPSAEYLASALSKKLRGVFRPDEIGNLVRRRSESAICEIDCSFNLPHLGFGFTIKSERKAPLIVTTCPQKWIYSSKIPNFIPTRELISLLPSFVSLYENSDVPFDETWRDCALLLGNVAARGARAEKIGAMLEPLEKILGGKVEMTAGGQFYLNGLEINLVAEGMRKIAMLARLMVTGSFLNKGYLFWDEPEANLNPAIIRHVAKTILHLCQNDTQVFIATHSLFLLRELFILQQTEFKTLDARCFGLHVGRDGVEVRQGPSIDDVGEIAVLDEDLLQSERYMDLP